MRVQMLKKTSHNLSFQANGISQKHHIIHFTTLTHVNEKTNQPQMVDVGNKAITHRTAQAQAKVLIPFHVLGENISNKDASSVLNDLKTHKGPVISTAIIAGVMGAKKTSELIPFCHQIPLNKCDIDVKIIDSYSINPVDSKYHTLQIVCKVSTHSKTGVEMEALTGVSTTALCIYDMLKALSHDIIISDIRLISKTGGKSDYSNIISDRT